MSTGDQAGQRRIMLLLPFAPRLDAAHGGGRVTAQFLAALTERHRVAVLYLRAPEEPPPDAFFLERCELIEEVSRTGPGRSRLERFMRALRLVASLAVLRPMWVTDWSSRRFYEKARALANKWKPDIIQIEYHVMGQYLSAVDGCPASRVLTEHEVGGRAAPYLKSRWAAINHLFHQLDQRAWRRFEASLIRHMQAVVVFTESDRQALETYHLQTPIWKIPFGTPIPKQPLHPSGNLPPSLLFTGSFTHPPNIDAATWLARQIFPIVQTRYPDTKLFIAGDQPPAELKRMGNDRLIVTGRVADITPYLDGAAIFVAPLRLGGGMRVKVLEALAAGKAIVATHLAVEGLDLIDGEQVLLGENTREIADCITRLLADPDRRASMGASAHAWARANLGWEKTIEAYKRLYTTLLDKPGRGR